MVVFKLPRKLSFKYLVAGSFFVVLLVVLIVFLALKPEVDKPSTESLGPTNTKDVADIVSRGDEKLLKANDLLGYQYSKISVAVQASREKQFDQSRDLMLEVIDKVPEDQILSSVYLAIAEAYFGLDEKENYNKFINKSIEILKKEGKQQEALSWQKELEK